MPSPASIGTMLRSASLHDVRIDHVIEHAYNYHWVLTAGEMRYFATEYRIDSPKQIDGTKEAIQIESRMDWPQARLVSSYIRFGAQPYFATGDRLFSLRRYGGCVVGPNGWRSWMLKDVYEHCHNLRRGAVACERRFLAELRFMPCPFAVPFIQNRISTQLRGSHKTERNLFDSAIDRITSLGSDDRDFVLCHGDMETRNLIADGGRIQVIDHHCVYYDLALCDFAHLFLSIVAKGYFQGALNVRKAQEFIRVLRTVVAPFSVNQFLLISEYLVLKKLALVRRPEHLQIPARARLLSDIRKLHRKFSETD